MRRNVKIGGYYVDIVVRDDFVVECYGDYWHCNPSIYPPEYYHALLHMTAREKWEKDATRRLYLEACGYRVLFVWESDVKSDSEGVLKNLVGYLGFEVKHGCE